MSHRCNAAFCLAEGSDYVNLTPFACARIRSILPREP